MIDFELDFRYDGENVSALKNVSGQIGNGKCIVLCGGSGCGKTTLLRCLNKLVPQFYEGELNGFCRIDGKDIGELSIGEVGELAASVFQDPRSQFFTVNSSTEVAFGLENHGVPNEEMTNRVNEAFELFQLEKLKNRNVYELSCGERQLVSILSAWAMDTGIILLDEPTANLDLAAIDRLRGLLLKLKQQGKTLILSEHRLYYLSGIADEYWLIENGELQGQYNEEEIKALLLEQPELPLRTLDLNSVSLAGPHENHITGGFAYDVSDLCFGYRRKTEELLRGVSFHSTCGEVVGLIGSNGCGKTTLGKLLCGLLRPSAGNIVYNGVKMKPTELQKRSLFVMQEAEFQFFTNSVINELKYGHNDTPEFREEAERLLKKFGMWEQRDRHPFSLSGGQMQKLSLMTAYFSAKQIVVLDEPTAELDKKSMQSCAELIREMQREKLVFVITHDIEFIAQVCTKCVCISDGTVDRSIELTSDRQLKNLMNYMSSFRAEPNMPRSSADNNGFGLNPIVKLLYLLAVMIAISLSNNLLMVSVYVSLIIMMFADKRRWAALIGGGILALLLGLNTLLPHTAVSFAFVFFPRALATGLVMYALIGRNEASRTLAALRKIHTPEKLIMICSVIFRFFPVLSEDMKLMRQSVRTRGAFETFIDKLKSLPEYIEILTVPMALRVIRIAETLSASAETRGIDLKRKKSSYVSLSFGALDIITLLLLTAAIAVGLIF